MIRRLALLMLAASMALLGALALAATAGAAPAEHAGTPTQGCEVEAEGSLPDKRIFELEAELEQGELDGELEFRDGPAKLSFESTAITKLVLSGETASIQGRG